MFSGEDRKADSHWEVNPGHLACARSGLLLREPDNHHLCSHNPLYVLHR